LEKLSARCLPSFTSEGQLFEKLKKPPVVFCHPLQVRVIFFKKLNWNLASLTNCAEKRSWASKICE